MRKFLIPEDSDWLVSNWILWIAIYIFQIVHHIERKFERKNNNISDENNSL